MSYPAMASQPAPNSVRLSSAKTPIEFGGVSPTTTGAPNQILQFVAAGKRPPPLQNSTHRLQYSRQLQEHQPPVDSLPSISSLTTHTSLSLSTLSLPRPAPPFPSAVPRFLMASQTPPSHPQQLPVPPTAASGSAGYPPAPPPEPMMAQASSAAYHPSLHPPYAPSYDQPYGRIALPTGPRMAGQRGTGKEIKRRTKTGCLTCRKRRIKCDEAHPQCKNCLKSKRECAGYDPMFKPHGHDVRPAETADTTASPTAATGSRSHPLPSPQTTSQIPSGLPNTTSPMITQQTTIDPSLQQTNVVPPGLQDKFGAGIDDPGPIRLIADGVPAKPTQMENLINIGNGQEPPIWQRNDAISETERAQTEDLYMHVFAYGLDAFFETRWFGRRGWTHLVNDTRLLERIVLLHSRLGIGPRTSEWERSLSLEGHIIWGIILLCRHVSASLKSTNATDTGHDTEPGNDVHEVSARTQVFESLITNQHLDQVDPMLDSVSRKLESSEILQADKILDRADRMRAFWYSLAKFCTLEASDVFEPAKEDGSMAITSSTPEIDGCLASMRGLLDQHEPRDILYSVAIARHLLRPQTIEAQHQTKTNNESDPATQLHIARSFLYQETKTGTSPLMTRVARMVTRSWAPITAS